MIKKTMASFLLLVASGFCVNAQVTLEDIKNDPCLSAANLCVYPASKIVPQTPAPDGFEPCYLYMWCRHGSRHLTHDNLYTGPLATMESAAAAGGLTQLGESALGRLRFVVEEARGRTGHLTKVGEGQLRGIAERMYFNYPGIFRGETTLDCRSTSVSRVIFTMMAFCDRIKELNPGLTIIRDCDSHETYEWGSNTPDRSKIKDPGLGLLAREEKFAADSIKSEPFCRRIFTAEYLAANDSLDRNGFMSKMFGLASVIQDIDVPYSEYNFYDLFTPEEMYAFCRKENYHFYAWYGASPETRPMCVGVLHDPAQLLVKRAEEAMTAGKPAATLRFCHDGNIGPWAAALRLSGMSGDVTEFDDVVSFYNAGDSVPMASNIQFVFYKDKTGEVLVKILMCERETSVPVEYAPQGAPYYRWSDLRAYLLSF